MSNMFKVSGQDCPVALGGFQCDTNLDCAAYAQQNPQCSSLSTTGTGLGWVDNGAVRSSSAGNLKCHPYRKVCEMYTNEQYTGQSGIPYISIILLVVALLILSLVVQCYLLR
jgi:hypothetical protein